MQGLAVNLARDHTFAIQLFASCNQIKRRAHHCMLLMRLSYLSVSNNNSKTNTTRKLH